MLKLAKPSDAPDFEMGVEENKDEEPEGELCWISPDRVCGPDCVAFNTSATELDGPNKCLVLLYMGQSGSGLLSIANLTRNRDADRQRQQPTGPGG